jgi:hypothetical protein
LRILRFGRFRILDKGCRIDIRIGLDRYVHIAAQVRDALFPASAKAAPPEEKKYVNLSIVRLEFSAWVLRWDPHDDHEMTVKA